MSGNSGMSSDWMKVMLEEIARKKAQIEQDRAEERRRETERERQSSPERRETQPRETQRRES
jgi:hypothetical protein